MAKSRFVVRHYRESGRLGTACPHQRGNGVPVGIANLAGTGLPLHIDNFIAGRDHGDARGAKYPNLCHPHSREQANLLGPDAPAGLQNRCALPEILALVQDVGSERHRFRHFDVRRIEVVRVLHHDDRVCARRQKSAGWDQNRRAGLHSGVGLLAHFDAAG